MQSQVGLRKHHYKQSWWSGQVSVELLQNLKYEAVKVLHSIVSKFEKLNSGHRTGKVSFHSNPKECSNYHTILLISHASKVMLKILQARLHQYMNLELPDVQAGFRKGRGTRDQFSPTSWVS